MVKKLPKISVITPSLNQAEFIEETINSVLSQKYPNLEYIVVDGGSNDRTVEILKKYSKRLKWVSEKDNGQSQAINKGLKMATGEIVGYINADDLYSRGALNLIGDLFKNQNYMWLTGRCEMIDEEGKEVRNGISFWKHLWLRTNFSHTLGKISFLVLNYISQPSTFWRKSLMRQVGFFDESLKFSMDYDYWLRLMEKYKLAVIDASLAKFRVQKNSKSARFFTQQNHEGYTVVKRYTNSTPILLFHKLHDELTLKVYKNF